MTEQAALALIREHVEKQFPRTCSTCARQFPTMKDYLRASSPLGAPVSYDAEEGDWNPAHPIGTYALATCACGTTLSLSSNGLPVWTLARLMMWARGHARRKGITFGELLAELRDRLRSEMLAEDGP